jgi:hypothetical protein
MLIREKENILHQIKRNSPLADYIHNKLNIDGNVTVDHYVDIHKVLHCPLTVQCSPSRRNETELKIFKNSTKNGGRFAVLSKDLNCLRFSVFVNQILFTKKPLCTFYLLSNKKLNRKKLLKLQGEI